MLIIFHTKKLQKNCSEKKEAIKAYGDKRAKKLMQRLMELKAAENLSHIPTTPPPRCHELTGNYKGTLSVDLEHPWRLLFVPANNPTPRKKDGGQIISIKDTH